MLGTKLKFSTVFHPEIDGQTKIVNRSLGNLLRILVGGHLNSWDLNLLNVEFAYNTYVNRTTSRSLKRLFMVLDPDNPLTLSPYLVITGYLCLHLHLHLPCTSYTRILVIGLHKAMPTINYSLMLEKDLKNLILVVL